MQRRHPDHVTEFSHRLAQIKFIILEIVIFIGFLLWLWDKVKHDFQTSFSGAPEIGTHTTKTRVPCKPSVIIFRSD